MRDVLGDGSAYGVRLRYVEEPEPLGTGGALKFAEDLLDERFLMLNGDILTDLDVTAQLALHEARGARGTLALTPVEDPSAYGLVRTRADGEVTGFVEKPSPDQIDTRNISAGIYVLERSVLELLEPGRRASIERDVFPRLVGGGLYGYVGEGYWLDIGTPERYLQGTADILGGVVRTGVRRRPALIAADARLADGARSATASCSSAGVASASGSTVERAVVFDGRRSARAARCATASSPPARASATARAWRATACSARGPRGRRQRDHQRRAAVSRRRHPRWRHSVLVLPPAHRIIPVTTADHRLAASSTLEMPEAFLRACVLARRRRRPFRNVATHRRKH